MASADRNNTGLAANRRPIILDLLFNVPVEIAHFFIPIAK
jgi:hypothetical protein